MNGQRDIDLVEELKSSPAETQWLEFKVNQADPRQIGKLVSALSNAARLEGKETAFLIWGIEDRTHRVVGTSFDPNSPIAGNQVFELWLRNKLNPAPAFRFRNVLHPEGNLVLLEIPAPTLAPTAFDGIPYIRVGSATPKLVDDPHRHHALIEKMRPYKWEHGVASSYLTGEEVLHLLDHNAYFKKTSQPVPGDREEMLRKLEMERLIQRDVGGRWNVLNLGAVLFANDLRQFGGAIERKAIRFVRYDGDGRTATVTHRQDGRRGYANGFAGLFAYVENLLPRNEHINGVHRQAQKLFPSLAVRELVANALIHQDMTISGAGPTIELFSDRIEITNPGAPLMDTTRMVDHPPRSRNEALSSLMRRMNMCEELGTGLDNVFDAVELHQLPAPLLKATESAMQVVLYGPKTFAEMSTEERVSACYWHAVLLCIRGRRMKNATLCARLGIDRQNAAQATRIIRGTLERGLIKHADPDRPRAGYYPSWWG